MRSNRMSRLVISEKPSAAKAYADVLGATTKKDGYYEGNGYIVSWCIGHLLGLAQPNAYDEKYSKWRKEDLPISPTNWQYTHTQTTKKQLKMLVDLMKRQDITTIINGADAGREGELIFMLVYEHAKCNKPVQRLWVSSMEEAALKQGFNNLRNGKEYNNLYQAAKCRQQADWLVGMNFSRLFSIIYNTNLRVGRVQTPTLAMVAERFEKINSFTKEPFYVVELTGAGIAAERERLTDKSIAENIAASCNNTTAKIASVTKQEKSIAPPKLYDLTTLQREANKLLGFTATKTLEIVQSLYEQKIVTYPRTDSKYITEDMAHSIKSLVAKCTNILAIQEITLNIAQIVNNSKVTDHHAIIPTIQIGNTNINNLSPDEKNVLFMICTRLICAVGEKHTFAETVISIECNNEIFKAKGKSITNNGWKQAEDELIKRLGRIKKDNIEIALPVNLYEDQQFTAQTSVREGFTSPPKLYTEATLLAAMETAGVEGVEEDIERKGLGTPATRASIIENLVTNDFIKREKKNLLPTEKGINLINILPETVKSPLLTADWENNLKRMERGEVSPVNFMQSINSSIQEVIHNHSNTTTNNPFGASESLGQCPRCNGSVIESPKAFACENSRNKSCGFILWKENKFFTSQGKRITKKIATELIITGRAYVEGLKSQKSGKTYNATVILDDTPTGYVNFKLEFGKK